MRKPMLAVLLVLTVALTGCSGSKASSAELSKRLDAALTKIDDADAVDVTLSTDNLPNGVTGIKSLEGTGTHDPAFEGTADVAAGLGTVSADVIAVDGDMWVKANGFFPSWSVISPSSVGAPDPASLLATGNEGLTGLLRKVSDLKDNGKKRDGDVVVTEMTGTLDGSDVSTLIPSADPGATFDVTIWITDSDVLQKATITGPFYGADDKNVTYSITATPTDAITITAPSN